MVIPVASVPFGPASPGRKGANLIESARIPCFGNEFYIPKDRIKGKALQKGRLTHWRAVFISSENGSQVKTETVYPVVSDPIAQTV